jgi:hypothetical protein
MMASTKEERSRRVANMRANFAQEGGVPDPAQNALLDRYIEGTATLADLLEHAYEYATTAQERQDERLRKAEWETDLRRIYDGYAADMKIRDDELKESASANIGMSREQRQREDAVNAARADSELSGATLSEAIQRDSARYVVGEIGLDEFLSLRRK